MPTLALDIGGANLKAADGRGYAQAISFELWRAPGRLAEELRRLVAQSPRSDRLAATMTAELADCFATKAEGVACIIAALAQAAGERVISIYSTRGEWLEPADACREPLAVAASNWHALAAFAARYADRRPALLVDVGSTTVDIIPIGPEGPATRGYTDPDRLLAGELVYTGVERTPVAALVSRLPWRGRQCPVASELFATSADAHLILGELPEEPANLDTADGRPRTRAAAQARLARMICADATMFSEEDALHAASAIRDAQTSALVEAVEQVIQNMAVAPVKLIISGHGEFLALTAAARIHWPSGIPDVLSLNKLLGPAVSRCACAHALAVLTDEPR